MYHFYKVVLCAESCHDMLHDYHHIKLLDCHHHCVDVDQAPILYRHKPDRLAIMMKTPKMFRFCSNEPTACLEETGASISNAMKRNDNRKNNNFLPFLKTVTTILQNIARILKTFYKVF